MVELLSKKTTMPVHQAEDAMEVLPNHVYLIPPKKNLDHLSRQVVVVRPGSQPWDQPAD